MPIFFALISQGYPSCTTLSSSLSLIRVTENMVLPLATIRLQVSSTTQDLEIFFESL